jgi:hypothetical protein
VLVAIVHNQPTVSREVAQSFIAMGWGNRVQKAKDAYGIAAIDMAWFTKAPRVDDLRNMALFQAMADGFTHVLFLDADMLHPDDLFLRILKYCDRPYVVSGFYTQRQYPFAPIALRDGQLHESGRYSSYRHDDDYARGRRRRPARRGSRRDGLLPDPARGRPRARAAPVVRVQGRRRRLAPGLRGRAVLREGARRRLPDLPGPLDQLRPSLHRLRDGAHWARADEVRRHTAARMSER